MQNIDVRFNATSSFGKVRADLAALEAQAASLNAMFAKGAYAQGNQVVDRQAWKRGSDAVTLASRAYREAASSSGLLTTQQIKATSEAERYTSALQKQKLSIGDMLKHRGIMKQVYQDQLRYQRMTAQYWGTDPSGRAVTDITIPKNVPKDLDNLRARMGMFRAMTASASTQIINLGKNIQWAGRQLTVGFTYPVVLFGAAAGVAAYKAEAGFAKINKVYDVSQKALTSLSEREKELGRVRTQTLETARVSAEKYGSTLNTTLQVTQELAATGLKGTNLQKTTGEIQRISALGDIDPAQTTKMVIALGTAFRSTIPTASKMTETLNFMNAASNATSLSLQDIAEATPRAATAMAALGVDAKQMTIMLVSMREAGVDAAEAANALKSATARILNPTIVAKATKMFQGFGANIDIGKMRDKAKGNFYDFIQLLGKAEAANKKLTVTQKNSANAALFGTFQFGRLSAVLRNMWDAQNGVNNQTRAAMDLQSQSADSLAKVAENSRQAMMNNPAGRFRAEWAALNIQLAEVGKSFLDIATKALGFFTKITNGFNQMSGWKKQAVLVSVGLLALAGPAIMLTGLFFNLFGQFTGGLSKVLRLTTSWKIMTKEEKMAALTAEAQNKAMLAQTDAVSTLAAEIQVLAAAYREASAAAAGALSTGTLASGAQGPVMKPTNYVERPINPTPQESKYMQQLFPTSHMDNRDAQFKLDKARNLMAEEYMAANNQVARTATDIEKKSAATERITSGVKNNLSGAAVAGSVMALSMGTMMFTSNKTADSIAKWALISSFVVPAVKGLALWMKVASAESMTFLTNMRMSAAAAALTAREAGGSGALAAVKAGFGSVASAIGPGGLITAGVLAVGYGYMKWNEHLKAVAAEQTRVSTSLNHMADTWAESVGKVKKQYKSIYDIQNSIGNNKTKETLFDTYNSGSMKQTTKDFKNASPTDQNLMAAQHFLDLQRQYGLSAKDAAANISALYNAAGLSETDADAKAQELLTTLGKLSQSKFGTYMANQIAIFNRQKFNTKQWSDSAKDVAAVFKEAWQGADPLQAKQLLAQFTKIAKAGWDQSYNDLTKKYGDLPAAFNKLGIQSADQMRAAIQKSGGVKQFFAQGAFNNVPVEEIGQMIKSLEDAQLQEQTFVQAMVKGGGDIGRAIGDNTTSIEGMAQAWIIATNIMDRSSGIKMVTQFKNEMDAATKSALMFGNVKGGLGYLGQVTTSLDKAQQAQQLMIVNMLNVNSGFAKGATLSKAISNYLNKVPPAAADAANALKGVAGAVASIPTSLDITINKKELVSAFQTGMSAVQNEMASSADATFDARWDAAIAHTEAKNSAAEDSQKRRHQAALDRVQAQIDAEKKADEIRQRLFDNEKTRLQRLADLQNKNIDFQVAVNSGNLDEAAKIQNDMTAQTAINAMDDQEKAAQAASDARQARLDKQSKALEKVQQRQEAASQRAHERQIANMQKERDYQKAMLDQRLELFKAYTAKNQRDLERWMKVVGLSYDDFGKDVKAKGQNWSTYFRTELAAQVRLAAVQIANDNIWKAVTPQMVHSLLNGMGFASMAAFVNFVKTGNFPKGYTGSPTPETHHTGGIAGSGGGGRGSIASNYPGLHPSEVMVRAQKGERIINRHQSQKHAMVLDAINRGTYKGGVMGGAAEAGMGFSGLPISGIFSGMIANMFQKGLGAALGSVMSKVMSKSGASMYNANAGDYAGAAFSAEQMKNAATIATVGSKLGMNTRDIEIGIMTAITESGLRNLHSGDRDSQGLFQQRPSQGWGTVAQVTNPTYAATKFFNALKGVGPDGLAPWMAAQAVQRSAFADGSNYARWWNAAMAIFTRGLSKRPGGQFTASGNAPGNLSGFLSGSGGRHRPINASPTSGIHDASTGYPAIDFATSVGHPVFAVADGTVSRSYDIKGNEPRRAQYGKAQDGYRSYGRVVYLHTGAGPEVLYAHLSRRSVAAGQHVKGGSILGYSGDTGNSTGPHLHFGSKGASPYAWLRRGGKIKWDNTPVIAHKGETVLSETLTKRYEDNVASGGGGGYSVTIDLRGAYVREDVDIKKAVYAAIDEKEAKKGRKRVVR